MVLDFDKSHLPFYNQTAPLHNISQIQEMRPTLGHAQRNEEPWSSLNTRVGNRFSELLSWQNGSAREQIHTTDAQHDGGHFVSHFNDYTGYPSRGFPLSSSATTVASISPHGTGLSDQQHGLVDGHLSERDPDPHSGMPHTQNDQFDGASTAIYGPEFSLAHIQDSNRPVSRIDRPSGMVYNFEPDTFQDNLVPRSNQMLIIQGQVPTHHDSPAPIVYGYQAGRNLSYRQHLDNYRRYLPYYQRPGTDTRAYQASNTMASLTQPPDTPLGKSPFGGLTDHALSGASARRTVGPVRGTVLATRVKGVRKGPLEEAARAHARDTRGEGSCWPCKIQRYKVSFCILL